ncbi:MAG: exonuclease domain-containing protein [Rhodocyclaceae bacterium]|nr:exonuclease domain-containing protein [Rhodocyclaceae bacterium]
MPLPQSIAFVDLETTGANPARDRITEIGIIELQDGEVRQWTSLVNPEADIPPFIQKLTGITPDMVADAPTFEKLAGEVLERLKGRVFAAHNARFDYGFLKASFARLGMEFKAPTLCTVKLSRRLFPQHPKHNLDSLVERHGLVTGDRHRALADADLLHQFWRLIQAEVAQETLEAAVDGLLRAPHLPPELDTSNLDDLPESPGVYLFFGQDDVLLTVGRDANLRKRVLAHFNPERRSARDTALAPSVRRIEWRETAGEWGAMLLEARLSRECLPAKKGGADADLFTWRVNPEGEDGFRPELLQARDLAPAAQDMLFGLYPGQRQARAALRRLAQAHRLCPSLLGLEEPERSGACAGYAAKECRGACLGKETVAVHGARLLAALAKLRLAPWPWSGPVGLAETDSWTGRRDIHVVERWRWLGAARSEDEVWRLLEDGRRQGFDAEEYKILAKAIRSGKLEVLPLTPTPHND